MSPSDLRLRFLTALGLPVAALLGSGCKKPHPALADASVPVVLDTASAAPTPPRGDVAKADAERTMTAALGPAPAPLPTCRKDEVLETLCGFVTTPRKPAAKPFETCGLTGDDLEATMELSYGETLAATVGSQRPRWTAKDPAHASFKLDPAKTHKYRVSVAGNRARIDVDHPMTSARYAASDPDKACCYSRCLPLQVGKSARDGVPPGWVRRNVCIDAPAGGTSLPAPGDPACPVGIALGAGPARDVAPYVDSSRVRTATGGRMCCYEALAPVPDCRDDPSVAECVGPRPQHAKGRPIRERGVPVLADTVRSPAWRDDAGLELADLPEATRAALTAAWARDAALEHASVASFARLSLELLALGAPPELVDAAHVAARDEIRHARLAFGVASRFAGAPLGPGPLPICAGPAATSLAALAREAYLDGCVGETVGTLEAQEAADRATDPPIRAALEQIARDEAAHAELAWRVVAWALTQGGAPVLEALQDATASLREEHAAEAGPAGADAEHVGLDAFGVLSESARGAVRRRALVDVVAPCTEALLGSAA